MTFTITLPLWAVLPLVVCILMLAAGLWYDRFLIDSFFDFQATLFAILLCLACWALILYGRYERWLVLPLLVTVIVIWQAWRGKPDRDDWVYGGSVFVTAWLLVVYGRFTA